VEVYTQVFAEEGALDRFEAFASLNGPRFYGLPVNEGTITLERADQTVPEIVLSSDGDAVLPFQSGERLNWRLLAS
jgi:dihydroorotase